MAIADDISVDINGNIRYTGSGATYTVLELHRFLQDLADDAQASGNDLIDITTTTPSVRSTDEIIDLNSPFNIDDTLAQYLYGGSVAQDGGATLYSGLRVLGTVETGTEVIIVQDGHVLPAFWGTGVNADPANAVIMEILVKSREGGADIDRNRILVLARELGDQYREFSTTLGLANSVAAISTGVDLNNGSSDTTIEGWTSIVNTEGFQLIDIDGDSTGEEYYSQWDIGTQTINDTYERTKWISQRAHISDSGPDTGSNFTVDDATILGQGQEFSARPQNEILREMRFRLRSNGSPTGLMYAELYDSDDAATAEPLPEVQAAIADDGGVFTDETTAANNSTANDMTLTPATPAVNDAYYFGSDGKMPYIDLDVGTAGTGTIVWEYWNGAAWVGLPNVSDGTASFSSTGVNRVSWNRPDDWHQTTVNSQGPFYYVRARVSSAGNQALGDQVFTTLAQSQPVLTSILTSTYAEVIFRFDDDFIMTANQEYFAVIRHPDGTAGDFVEVEGLATSGTDDGNRAEESPVGTWTGAGSDDLWFEVSSSPIHHEIAGELFRGITHEVVYDTENNGPFVEDEVLYWGTEVTYDGLSGVFQVGEYVTFQPSGGGAVKNSGKVLADSGTVLTVALELTGGGILADNDIITGLESGATADINVTITNDNRVGGEGILLALDDNGTAGDFYIQLIHGGAPVDNLPIYGRTSGADALVNVTVTSRTISPEFVGQSTGSNIIGAYGIGFDPNDVGASDTFFDLSNTQRTPPNNVTFSVTGLVSGEDRVLVGPRTGSGFEKGQWVLETALTGAAETAVVLDPGAEASPIASDTPSSGDGTDNTRIRVQLDSGIYRRQGYTSYSGDTFTIPSTDYSGANQAAAGNDVFVAYIDVLADGSVESYTAVYSADRDLRVRVRDGGATPIKTFETDATFQSSDSSVAAIRQTDA